MRYYSPYTILYSLFISVVLIGCTDSDVVEKNNVTADALELTGIEAVIEGTTGVTRAGTVTPLADYVGRSKFNGGDKIVFTKISVNRLTASSVPTNTTLVLAATVAATAVRTVVQLYISAIINVRIATVLTHV